MATGVEELVDMLFTMIDEAKNAEGRAKELKHSANEYCEDLLRRTEEAISEALGEARRAHSSFRAAANMGSSAGEEPAKNSRVFDVEAEG